MLRFLAAIAVLVAVSPAFADEKKDKPKPNTLTPREIAEGWILLFDGETTSGWKIDGQSKVKDGVWHLGGGPKATKARLTTIFADFDAVIEADGSNGGGDLVFQDASGESTSGLSSQPLLIEVSTRVRKGGDGISAKLTVGPDMVARSQVEVKAASRSSMGFDVNANGTLKIKSVKLKPVGAKPLFNGKNLDGWKVNATDPKRIASKWEVTKAGELSVKNGPGDLVTEKEFANFVLQFECKTLGDGLNSGIFFRCIPGQYQNGYEAQIQNAYLNNDRTKPKDFGTGAIYRRVPARKVVSNDKEWFTMTVVADGKHIATWVNGYQTVDWTDDRKENDNPRQGYRAAKGPISIQGHDPTTDILFRNIRIAELPGKKK
jgi:hypothetical protein